MLAGNFRYTQHETALGAFQPASVTSTESLSIIAGRHPYAGWLFHHDDS